MEFNLERIMVTIRAASFHIQQVRKYPQWKLTRSFCCFDGF
jgi:hypothetical protein